MRLNRKWVLVIALVASLAMATSGTLAYLTATDSATNTITVGNVKIDLTEGGEWDTNPNYKPTLLPGVSIAKAPKITNTGNTPAWVWMEIELPTALYTSNDVQIDWNDTYWNRTAVYNTQTKMTTVTLKQKTPAELTAGTGETETAFNTVSIPYTVNDLTALGTGDININVKAYAVQADKNVDTLDKALKAYKGENVGGSEGGEPSTPSGTPVSTADELTAALTNGSEVYLTANINMDGYAVNIADGTTATINLNGHTLTSMDGGATKGNMAIKVNRGAMLTLKDTAGNGKLVASCYGVYVQPNATFVMEGGTIEVSKNNVFDFGVTVWNGKFVMNGGAINARYGVWASNYWKNKGEVCDACSVTIDSDCTLVSSVYDIDISEATDTVLIVPATLKVNSTASNE